MTTIRRLLLLVLLCAACAPVVPHGPRVHPGASYGATGGWRVPLCDSLCSPGLVPPIGAYAQYGVTPWGPEGAGILVGATIPGVVLLPAAHLDLYLQLPALHDESVYGTGVNASVAHVMPYVQVGRIGPEGSGWFTTQGLALAARQPEPERFFDGSVPLRKGVEVWYWNPALAYRFRVGGRRVTLYASGAWGRETIETEWGYSELRAIRTIMTGISLDTERFPWPF